MEFGEGLLFKKGEIIRKIKQEDMVEELKKEIIALSRALFGTDPKVDVPL